MANPKYADLPGIAHDQPDVYETSDLPEAEQGSHSVTDGVVDPCDSVELLNVSTEAAYNKFKGKAVDGKSVDFTDSIGSSRKTGYDIRVGEWEMVGEGMQQEETPLQAYNRLQFEVKQLFEKVNQLKESSEKSESSQVSPIILAQQIEHVQKQLQDLNMEKVLGSEAISEMSDPLGSLHKKLLSHLEAFKSTPVLEKKTKLPVAVSAAAPTDAVQYELYVKPNEAKLEATAKISNLEQRLKNLEVLIGEDKRKLSVLTSNTDGKCIIRAINVLTSKFNLLDPSYLDQIENRLVLLHQLLQQVAEKRHPLEDADRHKISEIYELTKKVDELSIGLPQVVDRLIALKELHEQALQFSKAITQLDTTQQQIIVALKNNEAVLKEVQRNFVENSEAIESNIGKLNSRIANVQK